MCQHLGLFQEGPTTGASEKLLRMEENQAKQRIHLWSYTDCRVQRVRSPAYVQHVPARNLPRYLSASSTVLSLSKTVTTNVIMPPRFSVFRKSGRVLPILTAIKGPAIWPNFLLPQPSAPQGPHNPGTCLGRGKLYISSHIGTNPSAGTLKDQQINSV